MDKTPEEHPVRQSARVVLLDPEHRVLLLRIQEPGSDRAFWITPGGGVEPGETHEQAALRELREETGLAGAALGPWVWHRKNEFDWLGERFKQVERFYLVRAGTFTPNADGHTEVETQVLTDFRWWSVEQIAAASDERFAPSALAKHLHHLIEQGPPKVPVDVSA